jgi:hypothetical protein
MTWVADRTRWASIRFAANESAFAATITVKGDHVSLA